MLYLRRLALHPHEALGVLFALMWGTWVILPFGAFEPSPPYRNLAALMPEVGWGALVLVAGIMGLVGLLTLSTSLRVVSISVRIFIWMLIAVSTARTEPPSLVAPIYFWVAISASYAYIAIMMRIDRG